MTGCAMSVPRFGTWRLFVRGMGRVCVAGRRGGRRGKAGDGRRVEGRGRREDGVGRKGGMADGKGGGCLGGDVRRGVEQGHG